VSRGVWPAVLQWSGHCRHDSMASRLLSLIAAISCELACGSRTGPWARPRLRGSPRSRYRRNRTSADPGANPILQPPRIPSCICIVMGHDQLAAGSALNERLCHARRLGGEGLRRTVRRREEMNWFWLRSRHRRIPSADGSPHGGAGPLARGRWPGRSGAPGPAWCLRWAAAGCTGLPGSSW
jgi:hypothetical protein